MSAPKQEPAPQSGHIRNRHPLWIVQTIFAAWTLVLALSFVWSFQVERSHIKDLALLEAKALVDKDLMYRKWNAQQGGLWADSSKLTPNPYLEHLIPNRDLTTTNGMQLTLVNPAYMSRMVFDIQKNELDVIARIVSNKPINPSNASDEWEHRALLAAERSQKESSEIIESDGNIRLRYLRPLRVEKECLLCHQQQGYKVGDVRGGISVSIPMQPFLTAVHKRMQVQGLSLAAIWLLGVIGIAWAYRNWKMKEAQRQAADDAYTQSQTHFRAVVDSSLDCVVTMDVEGRIIEFNPAAEQVFGYRRDEVIGQSLAEVIIPPRLRDQHDSGMRRYLQSRQPKVLNKRLELTSIRRDGTEFPVELTISEALDSKGQLFFTGNLRDITDRQLAESALREAKAAAEQASRAKSEFLANMSHEIRTPMSGVIGMTDVLLNSGLSPEQIKMAELIRDSAQAQLGVLNDILDFSKIEAGKMDMSIEPFSLRDVIDKVCKGFSELARRKAVTLRCEVDENVPRALEGDALRMRQIIANLISNAIKFSGGMGRAGEVMVSARLEDERDGKIWIELSVSDNGIGMDEETCQRLFAPFTQADTSTTRKFGGTGLGLVISRRLVEMMGGRIGLTSTLNAGSTFIVRMPFAPADEAQTASLIKAPEGKLEVTPLSSREEAIHQGRLVLVAEDNDVNQEVIRQQLAMLGYQCDIAGDGREAYTLWLQGNYGLLISDIHMPFMDGHQLAHAIRAEEDKRDKARLPIIALTANVLKGEAERCEAAGMDAYLSKPIELLQLQTELDRWLPNRHGESAAAPTATTPAEETVELPLFDPEALLRTVGNNPAIHQRLLAKFLPNVQEKTEQLRAAIAANDAATVGQIAHALKSSSRAVGAMRLGASYERLERAGKADDIALIQTLLPDFEPLFVATMTDISERLKPASTD